MSVQLNRIKYALETRFYNVHPYSEPIAANYPSLEPKTLVPSGEYIKNILWTSECLEYPSSACCTAIPDSSVRAAFSATAGLLISAFYRSCLRFSPRYN